MLCSRFLRAAHEQRSVGWFYRVTESFFEGMLRVYDRTPRGACCATGPSRWASSSLVLAATLYMFVMIPKGFIPGPGHRPDAVYTEAAQGTSFQRDGRLRAGRSPTSSAQDPNVDSLHVRAWAAPPPPPWAAPTSAQLVVHLKPRAQRALERGRSSFDELRPEASATSRACKVYLQNPPTIRIGGKVTKSLYQFTLQTPDKAELYAAAERLEKADGATARSAGRHQRPGRRQRRR